jgi:hypothetical protein
MGIRFSHELFSRQDWSRPVMEKERLIQAWNFVAQAAQNSNGNAAYHERLKDEIKQVAEYLSKQVETEETEE